MPAPFFTRPPVSDGLPITPENVVFTAVTPSTALTLLTVSTPPPSFTRLPAGPESGPMVSAVPLTSSAALAATETADVSGMLLSEGPATTG